MVAPCRIACLRIPRFQIVAHQKAEPELKAKALALLASTSSRAEVLLCSKEARNVYPGMKFSEARAVCADLLWRQYDSNLYMKLQTQLLQDLVKASPQVSSIDNGIFLLAANGLKHLGGERKFCRQVQKIINTCGFADMQIGIADTAFAAQLASKFKQSRLYIVPAGEDREFISALSIKHLPVSDEMKETFIRLGIKTIGQILQIPVNEIQERFGKSGLLAHDLAGGIDQTRAQLVQAKEVYEAAVDLNFPVESLSQTQFILKSMLERICSQLKENGLLAEELQIAFFNDNDKFDKRPLKLLRPSNNAKFLLELIKLSLEANPLAREYTGLHIEVIQLSSESWQQNKISVLARQGEPRIAEPEDTAPALQTKLRSITIVEPISAEPGDKAGSDAAGASTIQLKTDGGKKKYNAKSIFIAENKETETKAETFALLLQRFITRMGAKSVVRPVPNDQHIPDLASRFLPLAEEAGSILPLDFSATESETAALACGLILKKSPSPEPVLVEYQGKTLQSLSYEGRWFKIKELSEPERLSGLWWENPVRKSYYIALIETVNEAVKYLVLLVHNHENNSWQIDGFFD